MRKEDEYVANSMGTLASHDVKLKFCLVQLFQKTQKSQFSISLVTRKFLRHGRLHTPPLSFMPL